MNREHFDTINLELRQRRHQIIDIDEQTRLKEKEQAALNSEMWSQICSTVDEATGKQLFSNADKRDGELVIRQTNSKAWTKCDEQLSALRVRSAQLRADSYFFDNDVKWAINHAADEINQHMAVLTATLDQAVSVAAFHAVRHLLAQLTLPEDPH